MIIEKFYRLGHQYKIIEKPDGGLWWESHTGLAEVQAGRCRVEGPFLILSVEEKQSAGFLKREWLQNITKLPRWERTTYFCHSHALYVCQTGAKLESSSGVAPLSAAGPSKRDLAEKLKASEPVPIGWGTLVGTPGGVRRKLSELLDLLRSR
jgi:hypothetical protein